MTIVLKVINLLISLDEKIKINDLAQVETLNKHKNDNTKNNFNKSDDNDYIDNNEDYVTQKNAKKSYPQENNENDDKMYQTLKFDQNALNKNFYKNQEDKKDNTKNPNSLSSLIKRNHKLKALIQIKKLGKRYLGREKIYSSKENIPIDPEKAMTRFSPYRSRPKQKNIPKSDELDINDKPKTHQEISNNLNQTNLSNYKDAYNYNNDMSDNFQNQKAYETDLSFYKIKRGSKIQDKNNLDDLMNGKKFVKSFNTLKEKKNNRINYNNLNSLKNFEKVQSSSKHSKYNLTNTDNKLTFRSVISRDSFENLSKDNIWKVMTGKWCLENLYTEKNLQDNTKKDFNNNLEKNIYSKKNEKNSFSFKKPIIELSEDSTRFIIKDDKKIIKEVTLEDIHNTYLKEIRK